MGKGRGFAYKQERVQSLLHVVCRAVGCISDDLSTASWDEQGEKPTIVWGVGGGGDGECGSPATIKSMESLQPLDGVGELSTAQGLQGLTLP